MSIMNLFSFLFLCCLFHSFYCQNDEITTIPATDGVQPLYIPIEEGTINFTLYCLVVDSGGNQLVTEWFIQRSSVEEDSEVQLAFSLMTGNLTSPADLIDDLFITGEPFFTATFFTNFTILNFTSQFDTTTLRCGVAADLPNRRVFILGFPVPPSVRNDLQVQSVPEGSSISVNLTSLSMGNAPFPPQLLFQWTFQEENITDTSTVTINDYTITFTNVQRNASGTYTLTVRNTEGSSTGSFHLNVQFPPEATSVLLEPITVLNGTSSVTFIAFTSITGNPSPNITWTGPGGVAITDGGRFNTSSIPGQLIITDIIASDNGTYTSTVSNGIGSSLTQSVDLIIAVPAGPPLNLNGTNISDTSVILSWSPPSDSGVPELSFYQLMVTPPPPSDVNLTTSSTTLLLYGIIPNTLYNVTVVGVATGGDSFDILKGQESDQFTFQTLPGAPEFSEVSATPSNGSIDVRWTFRHTGGVELDMDIYCQITNEGMDTRISDTLQCDANGCINENMMGVVSLSPVLAGEVYTCRIVANNSEGEDEKIINDVTIIEGLPSTPIVSSTVLPGIIRLSLRVEYSGVSDNSFVFLVDVRYSSNGSLFQTFTLEQPNYVNNQTIMEDIAITEGGMFSVTVRGRNIFGISEDEVMIPGLNIDPAASASTATPSTPLSVGPSTTSTTATTGTTSEPTGMSTDAPTTPMSTTETPTRGVTSSSASLSGGAIAGIIIAIIILLAIIALVVFIVVYLVYQSRGDSYKVEGSVGKGGVHVEEHDIDIGTELQSTKPASSQAPSQNPPLAENPPKQELHYADLADFAPNKRNQNQSSVPPPLAAKPMPIEEVQYAVIRPQDQQKQVPDPAAGLADENV